MQLLTFPAGEALLGIPVDDVQEILSACAVTPLALLPEDFAGVADIGGIAVPVADVSRLTGLGGDAARTAVVVLRPTAAALALRIEPPQGIVTAAAITKSDDLPRCVAGFAEGIAVLDTRRLI